jgi:HemY protein
MRAALWFLFLFAVAVALSLFLGVNHSVVTLFWPPYRVDLSLNLVILLWALSFAALYGTLRGTSLIVGLPQKAQRWRSLQRERAIHQALLQSLFQLSSGRYVRAQKSAQKALTLLEDLSAARVDHALAPTYLSELKCMLHLVHAESAHCLRDSSTRDHHFEQALGLSRSLQLLSRAEPFESSQLLLTRWHLSDKDPQAALLSLSQLSSGASRRTIALRLRLKSARLSEQNELALDTAKLLAKHGAFSAGIAQSLLKSLIAVCLSESKDEAQLKKIWSHLETKEKQLEGVGLLASERLMALKGSAQMAQDWLSHDKALLLNQPLSLTQEMRVRLVMFMEQVSVSLPPGAQELTLLEQAVRLHPQVSELQYLYGQICLHHSLWGKAQQMLESFVSKNGAQALKKRACIALAHLMEKKADHDKAMALWKQAALL